MWIKQNDTVAVITGEDRGTQGKVLRVAPRAGKLVVEGVNRVYKHVRRSQKNPQGGRLSMEMPIPLSNVALVCQSCKRPTRVGARLLAGGGKERYCKKCGAGNGAIAPPKTKQDKKTAQARG
jgi:large subunit ribosomal protein L24